jgi:Heterokaryon incompatibility protein (HET)
MSSFDYTSMPIEPAKNEIRLLDIRPCIGDSENLAPPSHTSTSIDERWQPRIQCSMRRVCLDDSPEYTALSYMWGDQEDRKLILLHDMEVSVTRNLENALYHLCRTSVTTMWVDALCINQSDDGEKSEAVQQMQRVYQDATHVSVWLGPSGDDSDFALEAMNEIGKEACDVDFLDIPLSGLFAPASECSDRHMALAKSVQARISVDLIRHFEAIARLTYRPWWFRVWVFQELVLARDATFACGFSTITFSRFAAALILSSVVRLGVMEDFEPDDIEDSTNGPWFHRLLATTPRQRPITMVGARRHYHRNPNPRRTLIHILRASNSTSVASDHLEVTKPVDRIFGMLGFASDADQLGIRPDYSKSCEAAYTDAARALLQHGHTDILALSQFPKKLSGVPKWVPDWTAIIHEPCGGVLADAHFTASSKLSVCSPTVSTTLDASGLIALNGCRIDTITEVGTPWVPAIVGFTKDWAKSTIYISEIEYFCKISDLLACPIYKSALQREEAVWRIPCGDMDRLGRNGRARARSSGPDVL